MAQRSGAAPRRTRPPARRGIARRQGRARPTGDDRGRQGRVRRARRSSGDDRHLRLRRWPVAPALRPDNPIRAPRSQAYRSVAVGRRRRRDFGVQFPGRSLVVERGARLRLRRFGGVEAVGEGAAVGAGRRGAVPPRGGQVRPRRARRIVGGACRWARRRRGAGRRRARSGPLGDRLDTHGPDRRRAAGSALRPRHPRARRQQRLDRHAVGRSRPDAARRRLRRDGHRRSALHLDAPPHRPRERLRSLGRRSWRRSIAKSRSATPPLRRRWSAR